MYPRRIGGKENGTMKRIACLLALLLLLIGSTASAEQDYDDLYARILDFSAVGPAYDENFDDLPEAAQALYVAAIYDMEMRCGGVCTFFCNEGPAVATRVSDSLRLLGLDPMADAYEDFVEENEIDLTTLAQFDIDFYENGDGFAEEYAALWASYPFDDFDQAYLDQWEKLNFAGRMLDFAAAHPEAFES